MWSGLASHMRIDWFPTNCGTLLRTHYSLSTAACVTKGPTAESCVHDDIIEILHVATAAPAFFAASELANCSIAFVLPNRSLIPPSFVQIILIYNEISIDCGFMWPAAKRFSAIELSTRQWFSYRITKPCTSAMCTVHHLPHCHQYSSWGFLIINTIMLSRSLPIISSSYSISPISLNIEWCAPVWHVIKTVPGLPFLVSQ